MSVQTDKTVRRRRKVGRGVPAVIQEREQKPFIFGWGAHLNRRERESLKEKIALFGGLSVALLLLAAIGWGLYQDNVAGPAARDAANNVVLAQVGKDTVKAGFFKHFEKFQAGRINQRIASVQQQISSAQSAGPKGAAQVAQLQAAQNQLQQQLTTLPQDSMTVIVNNETAIQRYRTAGVQVTPAEISRNLAQTEKKLGGRIRLLQILAPSGMAVPEIENLITAEYISSKVAKKLAGAVPRVQTKVRVSHILLPASDHSKALKLLHRIQKGANFAALAKQNSKDTGSAVRGGDIGFITRGKTVKPFDHAAFTMHVGELRLVQSRFGWHIMKVTGRQHVKLSAKEYSQSQQTAFNDWLVKQQALMGVRKYGTLPTIPGTGAAVSNPLGNVPGANVPQQRVPVPQPQVPAPVKRGPAHSGKQTTTNGQPQKR